MKAKKNYRNTFVGTGIVDPPATGEKWIQGAHLKKGAFTKKAKAAKMGVQSFASKVTKSPGKFSSKTVKQAHLAKTFAKMKKK